MTSITLIGRSSSHFTRVAAIFAHELKVPFDFKPLLDITSLDPTDYGGNPALKIPALSFDGELLCGTENICRALASMAPAPASIVWPEHFTTPLMRNAPEYVWHGMATQVQLVMGTAVGKLDPENIAFVKARRSFDGVLGWLNAHLDDVLERLPAARALSLFEVTLFCLIEHLAFRPTVSLEPYERLRRFGALFAQRASAQQTAYRFDT